MIKNLMLMEGSGSPSGSLKHVPLRRVSSSCSLKDIWSAAREGSLSELDSALSLLKKNGGNVDAKNAFGLTALHIATWRNHVPIVKRLLSAGADPDVRVSCSLSCSKISSIPHPLPVLFPDVSIIFLL